MRTVRVLMVTAIAVVSLAPKAAFAQSTSSSLPTGQQCENDPATVGCPHSTASTDPTSPGSSAAPSGKSNNPGDAIVVTGTRISRPNLTSPVPITSVTSAELLNTGNLSIGDSLNQLPQLRATFTQANSTRFIGTAGISSLDLRGLGSARTLLLVNGRRTVTATPGINRPDVNAIPSDLIERVDIVTGGNSAIYGSDAVAGVVNFILKDNFDGVRFRLQSGISGQGDRGSYFGSVTAGKNFAGGRGNVAFSAEYAKQQTLRNTDRDAQTGAFSGRSQFQLTENTGAQLNPNPLAGPLHPAEPSTGDGIFDRTFLTGILNNNISEGGLFTATCPTAPANGESAAAFAARRGVACSGLPNPGSSNPLSQFGTTFVFNPDGTLVKNPCTVDFRPYGSSNCQGGLGSSLRLSGYLEPGLVRKAFNLLAHYEISPAFVPFVQAQFVRVDANQEGQPTFFNNTFSINNPFLTPQARATLVSALAPNAKNFSALRFDVDFGGRGEQHRRDNYQATVGVRGTFNTDWKYEISGNYGHLYTYYQTKGNVDRRKYANSLNAVRNASGTIVCGINATVVVDPTCVPVNLFGNGQPSQAALDYFGVVSSRVQKADLLDANAFLSGNLSKLFELPGGPIAFVLGGEIRKEKAFAAYDPFTSSTACGASGCTFLNVIPEFRPPNSVVKEAYGEISIPLLKDRPFFQELTLDGAGRVSHYNLGTTGTVFSYNASGIYAPVRGLKFRVSIAKATRAPTQSDLYAPQSQTFLNGASDPCGQQNINSNPNRAKNCAAAGVPTTQTFNGSTEPFTNRPASGILGFNGSNPQLNAETSHSLTVGAVIQPQIVPGLAITLDYYRINLKNVIQSLGAQTIINQCYDNPGGINNPFCAAVFRNPNGTFKGQSDVSHGGATVALPVTGASFISGPFNFARLFTTGLDADVSYRREIAQDVRLNLRAIVTRTFIKKNYTDVTDPNFASQVLNNLGDPKYQGQISANLITKKLNFGYRIRYIGKTTIFSYETQNSFDGRPPQKIDASPIVFYPASTYQDFRLDITPTGRFKFYVGVDNAFNKLPPYDLLGTEGGSPYDPVGRFFYAGVELKF